MEISTHQTSSIPSYRYSQCEAGSVMDLDSLTSQTDFVDRDECSSMGSSDVSSLSNSSEESSDDFDMVNDGSIIPRISERKGSGFLELGASSEMLRIRFPFQSISIRLADFMCLHENSFQNYLNHLEIGMRASVSLIREAKRVNSQKYSDLLNDTIVDFYLNHVAEHILPDELNRRVTVLPSVFWHNLSILHAGALINDALSSLTDDQKLDARFGDVLDFVGDFDFSDVDYIVMPVNEWEHWSLIIVCHPFTARARMLCFDSQLSEDPNNMENIAKLCDEFFKYVWLRRYQQPSCSIEKMRCIIPDRLPQQHNSYDCGLYIVEFARRFLLAPPSDLDTFDFHGEYPDFTVKNKRRDIQYAVLSLCSNRELWTPVMNLLNKNL